MDLKGLFSYISEMDGLVTEISFDEIIKEIKSREKPTILINCEAFFKMFTNDSIGKIYGGRFNKIQKEFEEFLGCLKSAGAELIFIFRKNIIVHEDRWIISENRVYGNTQRMISILDEMRSTSRSYRFFRFKFDKLTVHDSVMQSVLYNTAMKFGHFRGYDPFLKRSSFGHNKLAREFEALAMIGNDPNYLFYQGSYKLWSPAWSPEFSEQNQLGGKIHFGLKQIIKEEVWRRYDMDCEGFRLLDVLSRKFYSTRENSEILENYFTQSETKPDEKTIANKVEKVKNFIHENVTFPLTLRTIESIVNIIFGNVDPQIVNDFEDNLESFKGNYHKGDRFPDEEVNRLIVDDPFSLAEKILNNKVLSVYTSYLDVNVPEIKPLQDLLLPWIRRTMGLLLENVKDDNKVRQIYVRVNESGLEKINVEAECPEFDVPELKQFVCGEFSSIEKFKFLAFITGIDVDTLKAIPNDYLMHVIIMLNLVQNKSLKVFEALAFTKALKDVCDQRLPFTIICPETVNIRAFRTSYLYTTMHYNLTCCLATIGLKDFITGIVMDNIQYQIYYQQMMSEEQSQESLFEQLMSIINA